MIFTVITQLSRFLPRRYRKRLQYAENYGALLKLKECIGKITCACVFFTIQILLMNEDMHFVNRIISLNGRVCVCTVYSVKRLFVSKK